MYYKNLSKYKKIKFHEKKLKNKKNIRNVIYAQATTVCIRNIKQANAHQKNNINIHLYHSGNSPNKYYGYGNQFYSSITKVHKHFHLYWRSKMRKLIAKTDADIIHTHNEPDFMPMKIISGNFGIPVIYDQHDFLSAKKIIKPSLLKYEKYCNENNDGAIYVTEEYKSLVSEKYSINPLNINLPNYGSLDTITTKNSMLSKLSKKTKDTHLVYIGAIDQHNPTKTRYLIDQIKILSDLGFNVHIYPSKDNNYEKYSLIKNVIVHKKETPDRIIKVLSQYDYGLSIVNPHAKNIPKELKFGFWNKTFDYLMAGIPQITLDYFTVISDFITRNNFGVSVKKLSYLKQDELLNLSNKMCETIIDKRKLFTFEKNISSVIDLYEKSIEKFHADKISLLSSK